jgi:hypothetical protein
MCSKSQKLVSVKNKYQLSLKDVIHLCNNISPLNFLSIIQS